MPAASTDKGSSDFTSSEASFPASDLEDRSRSASKNSDSDHSSNEDSGISLHDGDREPIEEPKSEREARLGRCDEIEYAKKRSTRVKDDDDDFIYPKPDAASLLHQETAEAPWITDFLVSFSYMVKFFFARLSEFLQARGWIKCHGHAETWKHRDFVPIVGGMEALFIRNIYRIGSDAVNRVISSVPGTVMTMPQRVSHDYGWTYEFSGVEQTVMNMGSYNYLGFAQNEGPCADNACEAIDHLGVASCSSAQHYGSTSVNRQMEQLVAEYLGTEAAICFPMGFGTNAMNIPALVGKGDLVLSDKLNHTSLVLGCRLSGATIKVFKHNDVADLEKKLCDAVVFGDPTTQRPYKKILIVMEGIYSMEGTISPLPQVIALKKKYKAYLFLDEAHSIGALGRTGRGVVEYCGCSPADVDIMMGTLTKSFAAAGGYIAGSKRLIDHLRVKSHDGVYGMAMSPPVVQQVISSMSIMMGKDGSDEGQRRIKQLIRNTHYFRKQLKKLGFLTYGHMDSPVVPCVMFYCTRSLHFIRETLNRNLATVGVCYPATPLAKCRARFCLSAGHTKEQLDWALNVCSQVADISNTKYGMQEAAKWRNVDIVY